MQDSFEQFMAKNPPVTKAQYVARCKEFYGRNLFIRYVRGNGRPRKKIEISPETLTGIANTIATKGQRAALGALGNLRSQLNLLRPDEPVTAVLVGFRNGTSAKTAWAAINSAWEPEPNKIVGLALALARLRHGDLGLDAPERVHSALPGFIAMIEKPRQSKV